MQPLRTADQGIKKLHVGNIPFECSTDHLKECFGEFGAVQDVCIPLNPGGKPRGFVFVSMTEQDIEGALESANGHLLGNLNLPSMHASLGMHLLCC